MKQKAQTDLADAFRRMHDRKQVLLLPNCWDAGSARLFERRGFAAVATTSAGMAWSLGYADGECAPLVEVLAALARITRVVDVPVTADIETGYGAAPTDVTATVKAVIAAGAVGINIEDGMPGHGPLRDVADAAARVRAARLAADESGVPIVINARVDHWMQHDEADPAARLADAIERAQAYLAAGADCIYPIGLGDAPTLAALVAAIDAPINVAAGPAMPGLHELETIGVARVSTATRFAAVALGAVDHAVTEMRASGGFAALAADFSYADAQQLFASR
ncbi:MAG TPA: isocitrate lyase/phosphoenolpyruvate mutase family protein [Rhodanobacter sp.]|jgi:2-methylisocitrate lyase-like PEP mutase family enzyme|nr:isocitrate lyase/phosphoenolpyruvate mutase family protein [Rhodanobacter sp.]